MDNGGPGSFMNQMATSAANKGGGLMSLFGKTPEDRVKALKDLSKILSGLSSVEAGLTQNGLGDMLAKIIQPQQGPLPNVEVPDRAALAAQMIIDMGFGRY